MDKDAATRNGSLSSARRAAISYAGDEIGPAVCIHLGQSSARGDTARAPVEVHDTETEWRRHPIAKFPGDGAARDCTVCHRDEERFLAPAACAYLAKRLVIETHDARLRCSASATVCPLDGSDVAR